MRELLGLAARLRWATPIRAGSFVTECGSASPSSP
jgi:hypothetical protein